jgi:hypothetical protein
MVVVAAPMFQGTGNQHWVSPHINRPVSISTCTFWYKKFAATSLRFIEISSDCTLLIDDIG